MNLHNKGAKELDFESKSLDELGNTSFLIRRNQDEFSHSIAAANLRIEQAQRELNVKEKAIQSECAVIQKLQVCLTNQNKTRASLLSELEALQQRLAHVDQDLAAKTKEMSSVQEQVKTLEADATNLNELVKKEKTNLPRLISAQEDLVTLMAKVQAVIEAKSTAQQTLSSDQLIVKHQMFMNMLMGEISLEPSSESAKIATCHSKATGFASSSKVAANNDSTHTPVQMENISSISYSNSNSSSSSSAATADETGIDPRSANLLKTRRLLTPNAEDVPKPRKRQSLSSNKKPEDARSHHDAQETRASLEKLAPQIRDIFRKVHAEAKNTVRMEKVKCVRKEDGQWSVPDKERTTFGIIGCQGRRTPEQGFNVRVRNQVISQKLLDTGLLNESEYVEAVFEDPRDATAAYHLVSELFN